MHADALVVARVVHRRSSVVLPHNYMPFCIAFEIDCFDLCRDRRSAVSAFAIV